jgi:hypothetical protein
MPKPFRRRCDARLPARETARDRAFRAGELAKYLRRNRCKNWAVRGSKRCRLHGGFSTGPTSPEGKARTNEAMKVGRARWLARLKSEGKPIPFGRKRGGHNRPREEREHDAYVQQCRRDSRRMKYQLRAERKARRAREREEPVVGWKNTRAAKRAQMPVCHIGRRRMGEALSGG